MPILIYDHQNIFCNLTCKKGSCYKWQLLLLKVLGIVISTFKTFLKRV